MNEQKISWKRSDLKWRGKQAFKKNYWSAVLVSLVLAIVMATGGSGAATGSAGNVVSPDYGVTTYRLGTDINGVTSYVSHVFRSPLAVLFALLSASAVVAVALIGILFHFFVGNVLEVGGRDFYIENLYSVPGPGKLLNGFPHKYPGRDRSDQQKKLAVSDPFRSGNGCFVVMLLSCPADRRCIQGCADRQAECCDHTGTGICFFA